MSTTRGADRPLPRRRRRDSRQGGQILVIFTGGLIAFLAIAALVFDVGQNLLDWRAQRDAADAAALAGSRYIADAACEASPSIVNCPAAYQAAMHVARLNGYGDLDGNGTNDRGRVDVHIPPQPGRDPLYAGQPGFLEVNIHTDRPSFFAAVLGMVRQNVDAMAIAGNSDSVAPPYSMLALNTDCDPNPSGQVNGNGVLAVNGPIVVNSNCEGALQVGGNGSISAPECSVVGTIQVSGSNAALNCDIVPTEGTGDPLANIGPGAMPGTPAAVQILSWTGGGTAAIPAGCPGSYVQIDVVGSSIGAGDARTPLPAFAAGDLAVVFAYRAGSDAPPDLPAGWTDIVSTAGADLNGRRIGFRTLDGTETSTGTWTNATAVALIIVRGQDTDTPIGLVASAGSSGATLTTPALTPLSVGGRSTVIAFAGAANGANLMTLAGATALSTAVTPSLGLHYQRNIGTWAQRTYGGGPATGPNRTDAVEILANPNPSTAANPAGCRLSGAGGGKYNVYRIHPGVYYGGLSLGSRARVYMAPGTYWLAGGGLRIAGQNAQLISVTSASSTTPGRGVFIYNSEDPYYHAQCAAGTIDPLGPLAKACIGDIHVNGGSSNDCPTPPQPSLASPYMPNAPTQPCQWIHLEPTDSPIRNLLVFVDRSLTAEVVFNGGAGKLELSGTIYNPNGDVAIRGGASDTVSAQIIAYTFHITGNGSFTITYDSDGVVQLSGVGLVQ